MNPPKPPEKSQGPTTFSHADFLNQAAEAADIKPTELTRRAEPTKSEYDDIFKKASADRLQNETISLRPEVRDALMSLELSVAPGPDASTFGGLDTRQYLANIKRWLEPQINSLRPILTARQLELFWNQYMAEYLYAQFSDEEIDSISVEKISLIYSALLQECLKDDGAIQLDIPERLDGQLPNFAYGLQRGDLVVVGNVGRDFTYHAGGTAHIELQGSSGAMAAAWLCGQAKVAILGSAGDMLGANANGHSQIEVLGNAANAVGRHASENAYIRVRGNTGAEAAGGARGHAKIIIDGNCSYNIGTEMMEYAELIVKGTVETYGLVHENFQGTISVGGQVIEPPRRPQ